LEKVELKTSGIKLPSLTSFKNPVKEQNEEAKPLEETGKRINKAFVLNDLQGFWTAFAEKLKSENKTSEYLILANRPLQLEEDYTIKLQLENLVQIDQLNAFKPELLDYLRKNLSNSLIMLETSVMDKPTDRKPYSQSEKLQHMIEKYPLVADLKKRLGLDMDY
jgi:DNA polymerase-3 subunit gamma/tau